MNDEQLLLANAYLDGELTDDERRIAEADPAVMAEVDVLRDLRAELVDLPAPDDEARETAITAAMAEFGRGDVGATAPSHAAPVAFRPRPAYGRFLGIAAAVVAVGVLGVVVANNSTGGDDSDSAASEPVADQAADTGSADESGEAVESVEELDAADADAPAATQLAAAEAADEAQDAAASEESAATQIANEGSGDTADGQRDAEAGDAAEVTDETGASAAVAESDDPAYRLADENPDPSRPAIDVDDPITNDLELGAFGTYLLELRNDEQLPPTPNTPCPPALDILDAATAVITGTERDVYIAVQEDDQRVVAIDRETCEELVDGPLFEPENG